MNGPFLFHPINRAGLPFFLRQTHTAKHSGLQRAIRRTSATAANTSAGGAATTICSSTRVDMLISLVGIRPKTAIWLADSQDPCPPTTLATVTYPTPAVSVWRHRWMAHG